MAIRNKKSTFQIGIAIAILLLAFSLQADREAERAMLSRLSQEISDLETLISHAEREQPEGSRVRFRYDWLRRDLTLVKAGIDSYLQDSHLQPRSAEELQGLYHQ